MDTANPLAVLSRTPEFALADLGRADQMLAQAIRLLDSARTLVRHHEMPVAVVEQLEKAVTDLRLVQGEVAGKRNELVSTVLRLADDRLLNS